MYFEFLWSLSKCFGNVSVSMLAETTHRNEILILCYRLNSLFMLLVLADKLVRLPLRCGLGTIRPSRAKQGRKSVCLGLLLLWMLLKLWSNLLENCLKMILKTDVTTRLHHNGASWIRTSDGNRWWVMKVLVDDLFKESSWKFQ